MERGSRREGYRSGYTSSVGAPGTGLIVWLEDTGASTFSVVASVIQAYTSSMNNTHK